jgi:hypothetical protein
VERPIVPNVDEWCPHCCERIRYMAHSTIRRVIANVYVDGRWDRVEHFHDHCYTDAGQPYGMAVPGDTVDSAAWHLVVSGSAACAPPRRQNGH